MQTDAIGDGPQTRVAEGYTPERGQDEPRAVQSGAHRAIAGAVVAGLPTLMAVAVVAQRPGDAPVSSNKGVA